jgi:AcrR family transcriptional regulator
MDMHKSSLTRSDFLQKGLEVLAADGPRSLTAARLARELQVTTGSFFWHFQTVEKFREKLKRFWCDEVVVGIINDARDQVEDPKDVLATIGTLIKQRDTHRFDTAMRRWAETDSDTAEVVRAADTLRGELITMLLKDFGHKAERAKDRTNLLGAAWRGSQDIEDSDYRLKLISLITGDSESSR